MSAPVHRWLSRAQGTYYLLTGVWPVLDRRSFEAVSGKKRDYWLVQTVGLITAAVGLSINLAGERKEATRDVTVLRLGTALGFAAIDFTYGLTRRIPAVYLADGAAQVAFIAALLARQRDSGSTG
jgi:hypothetical protein